MSDIIHLLPDSVANQIAAGEVIQRPASVVKELVENAIDAGATLIHVIIKDAGRTLIQIIDNGKGMSMTDARMAFERHATSKIKKASDLFSLRTMGFRGEALASIAAIAQVELRTRRAEDEVGCRIVINGSEIETHEPCMNAIGSNFQIKNIFFNVPARRKFLKSNTTELNNIVTEFERIALVNPNVSFTLSHNDNEIINLPATMLKQRIVSLFKDKKLNQQLLPVEVKTSLINISGYICRPEDAKKKTSLQYFFVNDRYMRHPYFHKAVMQCYEKLIPQIGMPKYFLYLSVDPANIDVNIHPTKTEIKFENESHIWQIISAAIKEALGKFSVVPSIDFDMEDAPVIPVHNIDSVHTPLNSGGFYNPFEQNSGFNPFEAEGEESVNENIRSTNSISSSLNTRQSVSKERGTLLGSKVNKPKPDPQWSQLYSGFGTAVDLPMNQNIRPSAGYNPFDESNMAVDQTEEQADFNSAEFAVPDTGVEFEGDPDYFHTDEVFPSTKTGKEDELPVAAVEIAPASVQTISSKVNNQTEDNSVDSLSGGLFGSRLNREEDAEVVDKDGIVLISSKANITSDEKPVALSGLIPSSANVQPISAPQVIPLADKSTPVTGSFKQHLQVKGKYIVTNVKSGVMMIDQFRASKRIFFEKYMSQITNKKGVSQGVLFPDIITLSVADQTIFDAITDDLSFLGFEISSLGNGSYAINGVPAEIKNTDNLELINSMIETAKTKGRDVKADYQELLALRLAESAAIPYGQNLSPDDMEHLIDDLFATTSPNYSPDGKVIISVMTLDEIGRRFK